MGAIAIAVFLVAIFAIILIHEAGHYLVARAYGFRVLEYFVGFGPRIWSFRRGEIEYGLKAIPAGGYVKIAGMNPFQDDVPPGDEARAYSAKPRWQRALVILAGPMSHFLVAGIIFTFLLWTTGEIDRTTRSIVSDVPAIADGLPSPAAEAGILPGDEIVRLGIALGPVPLGLLPSIRGGFADVGRYSVASVRQIGHAFGPQGVARVVTLLFTGAQRDQNDIASVVGVSQQVGVIGSSGQWASFLWVFAYVTLFIGIVNLIPLPPFDGGHLAVLAIEKVRGRAIDLRKIVPVSAAVMLVLGFFVISTAVLDVVKPVPIGP